MAFGERATPERNEYIANFIRKNADILRKNEMATALGVSVFKLIRIAHQHGIELGSQNGRRTAH